MSPSMVFGMGTGRSGSMSLAQTLSKQPGYVCFHESNPSCSAWVGAEASVLATIRSFQDVLESNDITKALIDRSRRTPMLSSARDALHGQTASCVGDVAFYYLPYVRLIHRQVPDAVFPVIRRGRNATIDSYVRKLTLTPSRRERILQRLTGRRPTERNHFMNHDGRRYQRDPVWDKCFPKFDAPDLITAVGMYWDQYYERAEELSAELPKTIKIFDIAVLSHPTGQRELLEFCGVENPTLTNFRMNTGAAPNAKV